MSEPLIHEPRILVVEDDADQRRLVVGLLAKEGYLTTEVGTVADALAALAGPPVDLVISDWKLPDGEGTALLDAVRSGESDAGFIVMTAYGTISRAVAAVRSGADDYLTKPFESQALLLAVERALKARRLEGENQRLTRELGERDRLVEMVGSAPSMQRLFRQVEKIATTDATVLLVGESGTGKELAARALHTLSQRSSGPFVAVNCAAVPEGLIEAEFFGAEKGAYTGADRARAGNFEAAHGGTLFLDEVGELPLAVQPKLLRALQDGKVTRVGGNQEIPTDSRIVAATNRDLAAAVAAGTFREDLYYRLNVVPLTLPPLRERREDIAMLVDFFVSRASRRHDVQVKAMPPAVLKRLLDYAWPGNVRQLANAVERLVLLAEEGHMRAEDLPAEVLAPVTGDGGFRLPAEGMRWEEHESDCLRQALELARGNRARAARLLDLPYKAFLYRLEKYGIEP